MYFFNANLGHPISIFMIEHKSFRTMPSQMAEKGTLAFPLLAVYYTGSHLMPQSDIDFGMKTNCSRVQNAVQHQVLI
jgi:hypothetical protein